MNKTAILRSCSLALLSMILTGPLWGQWSADISRNLSVENRVMAKSGLTMIQDSKGSTYLLWFGKALQYNLFVQRVDQHGYINWPVSAIQIGDFYTTYPNPAQYTAITDRDDNLVIALDFINPADTSTRDIHLIKMDRLGGFPWGETGITIHDSLWELGFPRMIVDENNILVLAVVRDPDGKSTGNEVNQGLAFYRISPDGDINPDLFSLSMASDTLGCGRPFMFIQPDQTLMVAFQAGFMDMQGVAGATHDKFFVMLLSGDLKPLWDKPVPVYEGHSRWGSLRFSAFKGSPDGCYVAKWEDSNGMRVQKVSKEGSLEWGSTGHDLLNLSPTYNSYSDLRFSGTTNDGSLVVFYLRNNQSLIGQMISPEGAKRWGVQGTARAHGILNKNFSCKTNGDQSCVVYESTVYAPAESPGLAAFAINWWGDYVFEGIPLCRSHQQKSQVLLGPLIQGQSVIGWLEKISDGHSLVRLQNLSANGNTGPLSTVVNLETVAPGNHLAGFDPVHRKISLKNLTGREELSVYSLSGACLYRNQAREFQNLPELAPGIYLWTIRKDGRIEDRGKLVF